MSDKRMVPVREWSCPAHEYPDTHECDCQFCERDHYLCGTCAVSRWQDVLDAHGDPVMREETPLDSLEQYLRKFFYPKPTS